METNGIIVPDAGRTTQFIPDPIGGWMYEVTTTTEVNQHTLTDIKEHLDEARATLAQAQAVVDALEPVAVSFEAAVSAVVVDKPVDIQLDTLPPITADEATSTEAVVPTE